MRIMLRLYPGRADNEYLAPPPHKSRSGYGALRICHLPPNGSIFSLSALSASPYITNTFGFVSPLNRAEWLCYFLIRCLIVRVYAECCYYLLHLPLSLRMGILAPVYPPPTHESVGGFFHHSHILTICFVYRYYQRHIVPPVPILEVRL